MVTTGVNEFEDTIMGYRARRGRSEVSTHEEDISGRYEESRAIPESDRLEGMSSFARWLGRWRDSLNSPRKRLREQRNVRAGTIHQPNTTSVPAGLWTGMVVNTE